MGYSVSCKTHNRLVIETILVTLMVLESKVPKLLPKYGEVYK